MRLGEILNLTWQQIGDGYIELLETKSGRVRKIPVSNTLNEIFNQIRPAQYILNQNVFICKSTQKPVKDIRGGFSTALKKAGIKDFRFHDLRHTVATRLVESGIDLAVVQELLGHATIQTTMRYAHPVPERKLKAISVLSEYATEQRLEAETALSAGTPFNAREKEG
jgi:integrase